VVINLRLGDVVHIEPESDSMGRSWYGHDSSRTDDELWEQNRRVYGFDEGRIDAERFATISYRGEILLVAAITGWESFEDPVSGVWKKALIGDVLGPGDEARDVLMEQTVPRARNPVGYFDDERWASLASTSSAVVGKWQVARPAPTRRAGSRTRFGASRSRTSPRSGSWLTSSTRGGRSRTPGSVTPTTPSPGAETMWSTWKPRERRPRVTPCRSRPARSTTRELIRASASWCAERHPVRRRRQP